MIRRGFLVFLLFFIFAGLSGLSAAETKDRFIRLLINEKKGGFSLFFLADSENKSYEPLFSSSDTSTSYLTVNINGVSHHLDRSSIFTTTSRREDGNPTIFHESPILMVREIFSPVRTTSSRTANGVKITVIIDNKGERELEVGLRMLIDTHLGESRKMVPFITDTLTITKEMIIENSSGENYWVSRGEQVSLMGSITNPLRDGSKEPDFLHFANWKRLSDAPWKIRYFKGRSFSNLPFSVRDSAVCYYYEPEILLPGGSFSYSVYLTTEDTDWYISSPAAAESAVKIPEIPQAAAVKPPEIPREEVKAAVPFVFVSVTAIEEAAGEEAALFGEDINLIVLRKLQEVIDLFIAGEIALQEHDLTDIEVSMEKHRNRN